jgi:hypothetical protein
MRTKFTPVAILKHGILYQDGRMTYVEVPPSNNVINASRWLYVSEDGMDVYMYNDIAELIRDLYKKDDDGDYVVTGWDFYPTRFTYLIDNAYRYYNERFE